ncbi:hypothetical protein RRG08_047242 [Elysia crispata]|uniref:Uncharacterized protein n=1 Tax=Elysia crispata TaxID=231223 RepID=A0AAE1A4Q0_9GAST|nr:hypothetical protein RRG08_047242 [Elysia crispata]
MEQKGRFKSRNFQIYLHHALKPVQKQGEEHLVFYHIAELNVWYRRNMRLPSRATSTKRGQDETCSLLSNPVEHCHHYLSDSNMRLSSNSHGTSMCRKEPRNKPFRVWGFFRTPLGFSNDALSFYELMDGEYSET